MKKLAAIIVTAACTYTLSACGAAMQKGGKIDDGAELEIDTSNQIVLRVEGKGKEAKLVIVRDETNSKCSESDKGCITSPKGQGVEALFSLQNSREWHFSRFEICRLRSGDKLDCGLRLFERLEYGAFSRREKTIALPSAEGVINLRDLKEGPKLNKFMIANQNSFPRNFFYRVEVCHDSDWEDCRWNDDPRWTNQGR